MNAYTDDNPLQLLKGESSLTLQRIQQTLKLYLEDATDTAQLALVAQLAEQMRGVFVMLELPGVAVFMAECAALARHLATTPIDARDHGHETLLQASIQAPRYLDWLDQDPPKPAFDLLPLTNQLRTARGMALLAVGQLPSAKQTQDLRVLATKRRPAWQRARLGASRPMTRDASMELAARIAAELKEASPNPHFYEFWWLVAGVFSLPTANSPLETAESDSLFDALDMQLELLSQCDELPVAADPARSLIENRLRELLDTTPYYVQRLNFHPPRLASIDESRPVLLDLETLAQVAGLLREMTTLIHDGVDRMARNQEYRASSLRSHQTALHEMANVLLMLDLLVPAQVIRHQEGQLAGWLAADRELEIDELFAFAAEMSLIEDLLDNADDLAGNSLLSTPTVNHEERLARLQQLVVRRARATAIREAAAPLARVRRQLATSDIPPHWATLAQLLEGVRGVAILLDSVLHGSQIASELAQICQLLHRGAVLTDAELGQRAMLDVLVHLEYHLDLLHESARQDEDVLTHAAQQLALIKTVLDSSAVRGEVTPAAPPTLETTIPSALLFPLLQPPNSPPPTDNSLAVGIPTLSSPALQTFAAMPLAPLASIAPAVTPPTVDEAAVAAGEAAIAHWLDGKIPDDNLDDPEMEEIFLEESQGVLADIETHLTQWYGDLGNREILINVRRAFHTLKGSGRMVGAKRVGEVAWIYESLLNRIIEGEVAIQPTILDAIDKTQGFLARVVGAGCSMADTVLREAAKLIVIADALRQNQPLPAFADSAPPAPPADLTPMILEQLLAAPATHPSIDEAAEALAAEIAALPPPPVKLPPVAPPAPVPNEAFPDDEMVQVFLDEADEILNASDSLLTRWRQDLYSHDFLADLRRDMHTLKGSSRMVGLPTVGNVAHAMESLMDGLAKGEIEAEIRHLDLLQLTLDTLSKMVERVRVRQFPPAEDDVVAEIREAIATAKPPTVARTSAVEATLGDIDPELLEGFLMESLEILDAGDKHLQAWALDPDNRVLLNDLRREMHTLKGGARLTGIMEMGDLAHTLESVMEAVGKGEIVGSSVPVALLQDTLDQLNNMLNVVRENRRPKPATALIHSLQQVLSGETTFEEAIPEIEPPVVAPLPPMVSLPATPTAPLPLPVMQPTPAVTAPIPLMRPKPKPKVAEGETIRVSANLLNNLINQMGESSIFRSRIDQGVLALRFNLNELGQTVSRLRQQLRRLEIEIEAQITFRYEDSAGSFNLEPQEDEFDPLELDRFSELQQLSRSLMEIVEDLTNVQNSLGDQAQDMSFLLDQQAKVNKEIQQGLMRTRMVRFETIVPRLSRLVRQVAAELNKKAEFVLSGLESEVDRTVLENMTAPLEHMLRNSLAHGIELPTERVKKGKPDTGVIRLDVRREGAELVLALSDDGAGINFEAIRKKALAKEMMTADQAVTEQDLINFMMQPGFSTADQVSQVAGRGVGMDVLNDSIRSLRGALFVQSAQNRGATFTVRLPYSLAVTQALLVQLNRDTYAVPLLSVEAITRLAPEEMTGYLSGKRAEHIYSDNRYPIHNMGVLFGDADSLQRYGQQVETRLPALLFRSAEASAALQVDAVIGSQEIIVKPVSPQLLGVPGISGATVLADGRVVLVLEIAPLVRNLATQEHRRAARMAQTTTQKRRQKLTAMVIDDSITMRKVLARFLERQNFEVTTAKDGMDAVAKLEEHVPDIAFLDIEMPRMDGFEVMQHIRNQSHLKQLPVIMVTSRSGDKHRERGRKLGVNDYQIKPYNEEELLISIRGVLGDRVLDLTA